MKRKILSMLLALALCIGALPMAALAADDDLSYLALGDSITTGYGLTDTTTECFVPQFATSVGATTTTNLAVDGLTTTNLLAVLNNDMLYAAYKSSVESADVITITIGGNDLMEVFYECLADAYNTEGVDADTIKAAFADPTSNPLLVSDILTLVKSLSYTDVLTYTSTFSSAIATTVSNINTIAEALHEANGDAVILVANQYNPYQWLSGTDYTMLKTLFATVVSSYNTYLTNYKSSEYTVADVYSLFAVSQTTLTNANAASYNFDFHPTAAGHTLIAKAMATAYCAATDHTWDAGTVTKEATCTENGETTYTCAVCGETKTEAIEATGHSYDEGVVTEPTCTEGGYTTYTCAVCGETYTADETEALGHTWDEGVMTKTPTTEEDGEMTYTCTVCGETRTESIDKLEAELAIVTQPVDATEYLGETASFTVEATGSGLTYQWQYKTATGTKWYNCTSDTKNTDTLTVLARTLRNGYQYRCVVTDAAGNTVTSDAATLTVISEVITVTAQPEDVTAAKGDSVTLTTAATSSLEQTLTYQWQYKTASGTKWYNCTATTGEGYASTVVTLKANKGRNGYQYRCKITDENGNVVYSDAITLTVTTD